MDLGTAYIGRSQCQVTGTGVAWMDGRAAKMSHFSFSGIHHVGMELLVLSTSPLTFYGCCGSSGRDSHIPRSQKGQRGKEEPSLVLSCATTRLDKGQAEVWAGDSTMPCRGHGSAVAPHGTRMGLPSATCQKLISKWKDPSPWSRLSEGNTNLAAATGDDALIRAATPTTRLYTFLINHLKFLTVRRIESGASLAERLRGCASFPGSPDGEHRGSGPTLWHCLVPWHCSVPLWKVQGSFTFLLPPQSVPFTVLGPRTAQQSWEQCRGEGEPAETSKLQRFPFS